MNDENNNRINLFIKGGVLLAVILVATMIIVSIMADYGNHPYLFFLQGFVLMDSYCESFPTYSSFVGFPQT